MAALLIGGKMKLPGSTSGHVVICGWSERSERIIKELRDPKSGRRQVIVIISDQVSHEDQEDAKRRHCDIYFVPGDPTEDDVLRAARVSRARSVIVLADYTRESPDAITTIIAVAIVNWCKEIGVKGGGPCIVAEAVTPKGKRSIRSTGVGQVVCPVDYGLGLLAQCAIHERVSVVYDELLEWSDETNEIYDVEWEDIPEVLRHISFEEAAKTLADHRDPKDPVVLLGVIHDGNVILNPRETGAFWKIGRRDSQAIEEGDALIVLAFRKPNLKRQLRSASQDAAPRPTGPRN